MSSLLPEDVIERDNRDVVYADTLSALVCGQLSDQEIEVLTDLYLAGDVGVLTMFSRLGLDAELRCQLAALEDQEPPPEPSMWDKVRSKVASMAERSPFFKPLRAMMELPQSFAVGRVSEAHARNQMSEFDLDHLEGFSSHTRDQIQRKKKEG